MELESNRSEILDIYWYYFAHWYSNSETKSVGRIVTGSNAN